MRATAFWLTGFALLLSSLDTPLSAQQPEPPLPPADRQPKLVLRHPGASAPINALAFGSKGTTLYVGGFDKQVHRYELKAGKEKGKEKFEATGEFRLPIAPGNAGVVNALTVSPDGEWVAVAGRAPIRDESWAGAFDGLYVEIRHLPALLRRDVGVIYLFSTDPRKADAGRVIRGPASEVRAIAFANPAPASGPVLVTAGIEWDEKGKRFGTVRVFDVTAGKEKELASRTDLPATEIPPGLAAWATGANRAGLRVAVGWDALSDTGLAPSKLLTWDVLGEKLQSNWEREALFISPLAVRVGKGGATKLLSGGWEPKQKEGGLWTRPAAGGDPSVEILEGPGGRNLVPAAIAALTLPGGGEATALLLPVGGDASGAHYELRLRTPDATPKLTLKGFATQPVLAASPDGRFLAVAGFADNRVEVYETKTLGAAAPEVQKLRGDIGGFSRVAFLAGGKLWLGKGRGTPESGGVILDPDAKVRTATPRGPKDEVKLDTPGGPAPTILKADPATKKPWRVSVLINGETKTVELPEGETVTVAAFLPAKEKDANPDPILAVAHLHELSQTVRLTLYNPTTGKLLLRLGGPTLPLRSLEFSGSRTLLAGAGDDGTVAVWSLKNAIRALPAIEGVLVFDRAGEVVVDVQPGSPAAGKLKTGDVIEAVTDVAGKQKSVKAALDFHAVVIGLKVGGNAQIKLKGQAAAVAVPVGTATGFRHPLFTLWVDPVAKNGQHDWVAWTSSGPYDANAESAEARIGWLAATGNPAKPTTFAPAEQYRKPYYKRDFLRLLLEKANYADAIAALPPLTRPTLEAVLTPRPDYTHGVAILRDKPESLKLTVTDPDSVLDGEKLELRWQIDGPGGATDWAAEVFKGGALPVDLRKHPWPRGEHRIHLRLVRTGVEDYSLVAEKTVTVEVVPPAPELTVRIDGKDLPADRDVKTENEEVEVTALVKTKENPDGASVFVGWTGGGDPVELKSAPGGMFAPIKVKLKPNVPVALLVTARNRGTNVKPALESHPVEVRVLRLPPKTVAPPTVKLRVETPHDARTSPEQPYVVGTQRVTVTATAADPNSVTEFEWLVGGESKGAKPDQKTYSETREFTLEANKPLTVRVRAKSKGSEDAFDSVVLRYDSLPEVSVAPPPALVTSPDLGLFGSVKLTSDRRFKVRVLVTSTRTGRTREFDAVPDFERARWDAGITLFPGENELGFAIRTQDDRELLRRPRLVDVRYLRPPVVAGAAPMDVGTRNVGSTYLAVLSPPDVPPTQLLVSGGSIPLRAGAKPLRLFGAAVWVAEARGLAVPVGNDRLKPLPVAVRTGEGESPPRSLEVVGRAPVMVVPPRIALRYKGGLITPGQALPPVGERSFKFALEVESNSRLAKVEVWHATAGTGPGRLVDGGKLADAVAGPDGFTLASTPEFLLRPGPDNRVRVVATNETGSAEVGFLVSYTPPAVRVVLERIREPKLPPVPVSGGTVPVASPVVEVEGSVQWDFEDDPLARDDTLTAVFVANGVAHLPVVVSKPAKPGVKERKFSGPVYLNGLGQNPNAPGLTQVRVELRSSGRTMAIPQNGMSLAQCAVSSATPFQKQRLHLLVIGVGVAESQQSRLLTNVVQAIGGTVPKGAKSFSGGRFDRPGFDFAYLYSPQLVYARGSDLNGLLNLVRSDIEDRARRPNEDWVNDVIVIYYQGKDWRDDQGRWFLHSATTLNRPPTKSLADSAIRLDSLPQTPGIPVALVNVTGQKVTGDNLLVTIPHLRAAWESPAENVRLLLGLADAIKVEKTFGGVVSVAGQELIQGPQKPVGWLTNPREMADRFVGLVKP